MVSRLEGAALAALDAFAIELPSWGFADTGTRFGKFRQPAAASTLEEKLHDAGVVHSLTGACPSVAVHVLWDFPPDEDPRAVARLARRYGVRIGSINPNVFQDQGYKFGSFCSPDEKVRRAALAHTLDCIEIGAAVGSRLLSLWLADGTNYPGQDSFFRRKERLEEALAVIYRTMTRKWPRATLLIEYKRFEPAFYHTDVADWGMACAFARHAGPRARVLVDTGHHLPGANVEHLVAFLLSEGMLGGFHFNDRKYADDDLTLGSIDPYAVFRVFDVIAQYEWMYGHRPAIAYMIDQSHNLKPKLEAMVQTVCEAQKLYLKARLVDREALARAQEKCDVVGAETLLKSAYERDVSPLLAAWRKKRGLPVDPLRELRASGLIARLGRERAAARKAHGEAPDSSYA
ncbi:sugar isomerase [bacterium]|nr:sugar isomerase [bacterium]